MDKKLLGKRINIARKERGWTSERLSEACNINATYLRQIESGAKVPSLQVFVLLCEALKVSPTYLLAEVLPSMELQNMDVLLELWQTATPRQIKMKAKIRAKASAPAAPTEVKKGKPLTSPMVGTFYSAPSPDAEAFVKVGQTVKEGDVVCIVEAMKLMNEIEAEFSGKIVEICVSDGQPVEFGQLLMYIE